MSQLHSLLAHMLFVHPAPSGSTSFTLKKSGLLRETLVIVDHFIRSSSAEGSDPAPSPGSAPSLPNALSQGKFIPSEASPFHRSPWHMYFPHLPKHPPPITAEDFSMCPKSGHPQSVAINDRTLSQWQDTAIKRFRFSTPSLGPSFLPYGNPCLRSKVFPTSTRATRTKVRPMPNLDSTSGTLWTLRLSSPISESSVKGSRTQPLLLAGFMATSSWHTGMASWRPQP